MDYTLFDRHDSLNWIDLNKPVIGGRTEDFIQKFHKQVVNRYRETARLRQELAARCLDVESARQEFNTLIRCFEGLLGESHIHYWLAKAYAKQYPEKSNNRFFVSFHFCALDAAWHFLDIKSIDRWKDISVLNALRKSKLLPWKVGIKELARVADRNQDFLPDLDDNYLSALQSEMNLACELFGEHPKDQRQSLNALAQQESKSKKSNKHNSSQGGTDIIILGALCAHHKYESCSCGNMDPIRANQLAKMANVSPGSVSAFWKRRLRMENHEGSYKTYLHACRHSSLPMKLALWLGDAPTEDAIQLLEDRIVAKTKNDDD